jgi:hypothetical protein
VRITLGFFAMRTPESAADHPLRVLLGARPIGRLADGPRRLPMVSLPPLILEAFGARVPNDHASIRVRHWASPLEQQRRARRH